MGAGGEVAKLGQLPPAQVSPRGLFQGLSSAPAARKAQATFLALWHADGRSHNRGGLGGSAYWGMTHLHPLLLPCPGIFSAGCRNGARSAKPQGQLLR